MENAFLAAQCGVDGLVCGKSGNNGTIIMIPEEMYMKVKDCMTPTAVTVSADESAAAAARIMARSNVGSLPVRGRGGRLCGIITDRDLVLRCMAAGEDPRHVPVGRLMTTRLAVASPEESVFTAAERMAREQVRRLPVVRDGRLLGMVSLADLSRREDYAMEAAAALTEISSNVKKR